MRLIKNHLPLNNWAARLILSIVVIFSLFTPLSALADGCNIGEILPQCACSGNCQITDFLALASNLAQWGVGLLSGLVVGLLIYGGFGMMMTFGNTEKIEANKKLLGGTFRGMAIVLLGWVLVNTIIMFLTGSADGTIFQGAGVKTSQKWWHFEETSACASPQQCTNVDPVLYPDRNKSWQNARDCISLSICPGDNYVICCNP